MRRGVLYTRILVHSYTRALVHPLVHPYTRTPVHELVHSFTHTPTRTLLVVFDKLPQSLVPSRIVILVEHNVLRASA